MKQGVFVILLPLAMMTSCSTHSTVQPKENMNTGTTLNRTRNSIGIGLLEMNTEHPIPLIRNAKDSLPFDTLRFEIDKAGKTKFIFSADIEPYRISEGDSFIKGNNTIQSGLISFSPELKFRVIDTSNNIFEVVMNEQTEAICFINMKTYIDLNNIDDKDSTFYNYEPWPDYIKRSEFITKKDLVIYDKPDGNIIFENKGEKFLPFQVVQVAGDWIKLKKAFGREFNFDDIINYNGWTQWRSKDRILISITEKTYE